MIKIGAITIGQAPRVDVTGDITPILGENIELIQAGGLDGLTREEILKFTPQEGDYVLISRLKDGSNVTFAERFILPRLQMCIENLEKQDVRLIMFLCTGDFPDTFKSKVPLIFPCKVLNGVVPALTGSGKISVITPLPDQVKQSENKWKNYVKQVTVTPASPYGQWDALEKAAHIVKEHDSDLVVMDCIGYNREMKKMVMDISSKNVVLSRTILARSVTEILTV